MSSSDLNGQRRYSRIPFHSDIQLHLASAVQTVHLLDIALKGALVESGKPIAVTLGQDCSLLLRLDGHAEKIEMKGRVVHQEGERIGIECRNMDVDSLTSLRRLLELNLGDAALVDRELSHMFELGQG